MLNGDLRLLDVSQTPLILAQNIPLFDLIHIFYFLLGSNENEISLHDYEIIFPSGISYDFRFRGAFPWSGKRYFLTISKKIEDLVKKIYKNF